MKILYINNYRESSGWSQAGRDMILSMDAANINVVPRPIFVTGNKCDIPHRIKELELKSADNCDVCIQHVLPHMLEYNGNYKKNICLFASETNQFQDSNWVLYLNLMSEVWTINNESKQACIDSGVKVPIKVVPHACDPERYNKTFNKLNIPVPQDQIIFYTIGEFTRRKNLVSLVKAFHLEFDRLVNVQLLLKVNKSGISGPELSKVVGEFCNDIKKGLKLYTNITDYKPELILTDHLTDEQLLQLHYTCDVYCNTSLGEAWNLPLFDAAAIGNYVISTDEGGPHDYLSNHPYSSLVKSSKESAFGFNDTHANLYTGRELVSNINIGDLCLAMRKAYELKKEKNIVAGRELAARYSYNVVGNLIKSYLEE